MDDALPRRPWQTRDYRIAWAAAFINDTGDWVLAIALPVFVFVETESGAATALLFVFQLATGALVGPLGGSLVDRWDLRRCLVATNVAQALAVLPLLAVTAERIWPAYLVMVLQTALKQINDPATISLIPRVVGKAQLTNANAGLAAASSLARLGGASLGGVLIAWKGLGSIVLVDAMSFVIVAASMRFLRADTAPVAAGDREQATGIRTVLRSLGSHPPLREVLMIHGVEQVAQGGFIVLFVVFVIETLGDDGSGLGVIRGTMAIGALAGAAIIARLASRVSSLALYGAGSVGMGIASFLIWNAPEVTTAIWAYVLLFSLSGIPGSAMGVGFTTTVQTHSPAHSLGRVVGLMGSSGAVGTAIGSIAAGVLVDRVGVRLLLNVEASIYLVAGLLIALTIRRRSA